MNTGCRSHSHHLPGAVCQALDSASRALTPTLPVKAHPSGPFAASRGSDRALVCQQQSPSGAKDPRSHTCFYSPPGEYFRPALQYLKGQGLPPTPQDVCWGPWGGHTVLAPRLMKLGSTRSHARLSVPSGAARGCCPLSFPPPLASLSHLPLWLPLPLPTHTHCAPVLLLLAAWGSPPAWHPDPTPDSLALALRPLGPAQSKGHQA